MDLPISQTMQQARGAMSAFLDFFEHTPWAERIGDPAICDFVAGNPQEMPIPAFVEAIRAAAVPQDPMWFAYAQAQPSALSAVAQSLRARTGIPYGTEHMTVTTGSFGGLAVLFATLADPGDEIAYLSPPWFFYAGMIAAAGATPVRIPLSPPRFDLDVDAVAAAITPRTRAIIVNTPNNPSGRIYTPDELQRLAAVLAEASGRNGRPVFLIADESYNRIVFDGRTFTSPATAYRDTFVVYTYGKTLLTPGERIGYVGVHPEMENATTMREALFGAQVVLGYKFPNRILQHAIGDLEALSIDIDHLQHKRDRMVEGLREIGLELESPEGTFYLLPKSPTADSRAFVDLLAARDVFVLPGSTVELPGYFRISLTATDDMIERSLPGFAAAFKEATA